MQRLSIGRRQIASPLWRGSRAWLSSGFQISPLFKPKPQPKVNGTSSPYVYTIADIDGEMLSQELTHPTLGVGKGFAKSLFDRSTMSPTHLSPKDFDYELPKEYVPEIAFVGRSNVGKSTLVGALLGDTSLVRVSKSPGRTRSIIYFAMNDKKETTTKPMCYLLDLPGYGYAKVSKQEQQQWEDNLSTFMRRRAQDVLRRTFVLMDCRHGPTKTDVALIKLMDAVAAPYQIVLTKLDLCTKAQVAKSVAATVALTSDKKRRACYPVVVTVSSKERLGLDELKWFIAQSAGILYE